MISRELVNAYHRLYPIKRFDHPSLPTELYHDNVGRHVVGIVTSIQSLEQRYPPNTINWPYARYVAIHHDDPELIHGDTVTFIKRGHSKQSDILKAAKNLGWSRRKTAAVLGYEETVDCLSGTDPIIPCKREHIIPAVYDLWDAANLFHLETVRNMHTDAYRAKAPLPNAALIVAPNRLLSFMKNIPKVTTDTQFSRIMTEEIRGMLRYIHGAWAQVPRSEKSLVMRTMMAIVENHI